MEKKDSSPFPQFVFGLPAVVLLVAYFGYFFVIPQTPARIARPSASLIDDFRLWSWIVSLPLPIPPDPQSVAILLVVLTGITFAAYGLAVYLSWKAPARPNSLALVLIPACGYLLLSTFALPNLNTDIFNYMIRGRLSAVYNKDPYQAAVDEIPHDPVYPYAGHGYTEEAEWWKLPLWTSIEIGLAKLTGENVARNLLIYRIAFLLVNLSNIVLIAIIVNKINRRYLLSGMVLYAWSPIIVLFGQSKGDTFIVFFLLLAILLLVFERRNIAIVPLTLSVLIKLTTLPFAAAYMLMYLKGKRWRDYVALGSLFAITAAFFYLRYGLGEFLAAQTISVINMSGGSAPDLLRTFLRVLFIGLILLVGLTRSGDKKQMIMGWILLALFFSLFLINYGKAWYLMTLVALVCLIPDWRAVSMTYMISFSGFLIYTWDSAFNPGFPPPIFFSPPRFFVFLILPVVVLIAIAAIAVWKILQQRWGREVDII